MEEKDVACTPTKVGWGEGIKLVRATENWRSRQLVPGVALAGGWIDQEEV